MEHAVTVRDGYGDWGYSAIVGDGLAARFTLFVGRLIGFTEHGPLL